MDRDEFNELMKRAGLNKKRLAEILETSYQGVNSWGTNGRGYPYWVKSWLINYIKAGNFDKIGEMFKSLDTDA
ncbi:hypothetical protein [Campylobacter showae]|uniref:Uncharacterized protein n=1 Tax=Campylobacter showae CSUNSWCD TaxID=1244083 RepID=M5ILV9_9BACT|nr:hypothetical protein [Campylobacter showae]EKU12230.1 hypothetical protein CSUNSWCD_170 [Campylobacter showae CSUNSWCD]